MGHKCLLVTQTLNGLKGWGQPMPKRPPRRRLSSNAVRAGDPPVAVNPRQVASPRASGASWKVISRELGIGVGTACRALQPPSKNPAEFALASARFHDADFGRFSPSRNRCYWKVGAN